jgi:hypothetical protein
VGHMRATSAAQQGAHAREHCSNGTWGTTRAAQQGAHVGSNRLAVKVRILKSREHLLTGRYNSRRHGLLKSCETIPLNEGSHTLFYV